MALALATIATLPLILRPSLPTLTDAEMHIYRVAQIESALRNGEYYIRWAPDFYFGHGYPVFNYYSPLSYYLGAVYSWLTGTGPVAGMRAVLALTIILGTVGMYLFARDRWRAESGLIAAAAWTFAPYVLYIDPYGRGDIPQALALATGPGLMWAFDRLRHTAKWQYLAVAGVLLGVLILSHPLMALMLYAVLLAFLVWTMVVAPGVPRLQCEVDRTPTMGYALVGTGILMGLLLAAFYWLPVGFERSAVKISNVADGFFDFRNHFLTLGELMGPSPRFDYGASELSFRFNLGVAQWVLAAVGFSTVFWRKLRRVDTLFFAFAGVASMYLMTRASEGVWAAVPYMSFFQFPSRFLGPAALVLALLAGASLKWTELTENPWPRRLYTPAAILFILVVALPLMFPRPWGEFGPVTQLRMIEVELSGRALGTTSADDFLPATVDVNPAPQPSVIAQYEAGAAQIDRLNRAVLPAEAEVALVDTGAQYDVYAVSSPEPFVMRLYRFYFPGWTARVDGVEAPIEVAKPEGFIAFPVEAGEHTVTVRLEMTWPRQVGWGLTAVGLVMLAVAVVQAVRHWPTNGNGKRSVDPQVMLGPTTFTTVGVALLVFALVRLVGSGPGVFWLQSEGDEVLVAETQQVVRVGSEFRFLGYDLSSVQVVPGQTLTVTAYWRAVTPPSLNYQVFVHLVGPDGQLYGQSDKLNPAGFPTMRWPTDQYVRDEHALVVRPDAPSGVYQLKVGLWNQSTGQRVPVYAADGVTLTPDSTVTLPVEITVQP